MSRPASARRGLLAHPYLLLMLTTLFWGGNAIAGKLAAGSVPPMTLTAVRWMGAAAIMYFLARPHLSGAMQTLRARWMYVFALGTVGFTVFNISLYGALNYTSAINVSIEQSGMPMTIILLTYAIYREPITPVQGLGVALSILGVLVTATHGDLAAVLRLDVNLGDAIMLVAILTYSAYSVALRHKPALPWQVFLFALSASAAIAALPGLAFDIAWGRLPAANWITPGVLFYVILFPSLLAQLFYIHAVEQIGANRAGLFINLVPVYATVLAVVLLKESLHGYQATGLALVIGGIALAETSARRRLARPPETPQS